VRLTLAWILASAPAVAQPVLTAVYSLATHQTTRWTTERDPLAKIAGACRIAPGSPLPSVMCTAPPREPRLGGRYYYSVVLFRDLEENLYLTACAAPSRDTRCNELQPGQTFSAELEEQTVRIVVDQEQLPLRLLESRPKPRTIDSPTEGTPSQVRPTPGTPSVVSWSRIPPAAGSPSQVTPSAASVTVGAPSQAPVSEVSTAVAAPTSSRLILYCATPEARVFVDGKLAGTAPIELPVLPGRHTISVRAPSFREWSRTVVIAPGGSVKVSANLERLER